MLDLHIQSVFADDPGQEAPAATRERLKGGFPAGTARRMTTLGMLVGNAVARVQPLPGDAIVYASGYAESRALEDFIDSFPSASPTLFQMSIQPSAVQQLMIGRQCPVGELMPLSGGALLAFHAIRAAALSPSPRVIVCGGEERGTWLLERRMASDRAFAFGLVLTREPRESRGRIGFRAGGPASETACPALAEFAAALAERRPLRWTGAGGEWSVAWT